MQTEIDLVVNTFERTYRAALAPGVFPRIEAENLRSFARKVALINNVNDPDDARQRAEALLAKGEIDAFFFVADLLDGALKRTGLSRRDLGRVPHYTDCALVAITLPGAPWLLYWDAEVTLRHPANWIDPALELMEKDARVLVANPAGWRGEVNWMTFDFSGPFALGYGFSDAVFLARRADLARPIYRERCLASVRFPLAHIAPVFEQRVDSYMRRHRRLRATHASVVYEHPDDWGLSYPNLSLAEALRRRRNYIISRILGRLHLRHPCLSM